jgi:hypothetical protein
MPKTSKITSKLVTVTFSKDKKYYLPCILGNKPMGLLSEQNIFFGNKPYAYARTKFFFVL